MVENRFVGMKSRASTRLRRDGPVGAHRALESLVMDREVMLMQDSLIRLMPAGL